MTDTPLLDQPSESRPDMNCQLVKPREYCELAVSNRRLERCGGQALGWRGLRDSVTGITYRVDESELIHYDVLRDALPIKKPR